MKKALVLSGGGSKGAYQIGVLKELMGNQQASYDIMTGVSVGALNVAGLAMFPKNQGTDAIKWLEQFWLTKVNQDNIYKRWFPFGSLHSLWEKSVYNSSPLQELVHKTYDHNKLLASGIHVAVGAVSLDTGEYRYVDQGNPNFVEWVLASSSYPVFFEPIWIDGHLWSDGGIKGVTPLAQAIRMGADEVDVIITTNPFAEVNNWNTSRKAAVPEQILRVLDLMNSQIIANDIKITGLKNDLADPSTEYKHVKVRVFYPRQSLGSGLDFNPDLVKKNIQIGHLESLTFDIID